MVLGVLVAICIGNDDIIQGIMDLTGGMGAVVSDYRAGAGDRRHQFD